MAENMKYHLVLEARPGDFMPIDINLLLNNTIPLNYNSLNAIDEFTKKYTKEDILTMIENNNIVSDHYLKGKLQIINDNKYRYLVLTSDMDFSLDTFFAEYINNKRMMNKFLNVYIKYCKESQEEMKSYLIQEDIYNVLETLFKNSYENVRNIYTYIYENIYLKS